MLFVSCREGAEPEEEDGPEEDRNRRTAAKEEAVVKWIRDRGKAEQEADDDGIRQHRQRRCHQEDL